MSTIKEIESSFLLRRAELDALDQALAKERRTIQINAIKASRAMTSDEKIRLKEIGSTRHEVGDALLVFSLITLDNLENADDIDELRLEVSRINEMLEDDLSYLQELDEYAEKASKLAQGLASVSQKLLRLVV